MVAATRKRKGAGAVEYIRGIYDHSDIRRIGRFYLEFTQQKIAPLLW